MNIRLNFGPKAGEVQFIRPDVAKQLIANGRATDPRLEEVATPAVVAEVQQPPVRVRRERRS
jgi:hypothetical protein